MRAESADPRFGTSFLQILHNQNGLIDMRGIAQASSCWPISKQICIPALPDATL